MLTSCGPVESGPPDLEGVEAHLGLTVGHIPEGCDPVGLSGDGRGNVVGASFACPDDSALIIERFASEVVEDGHSPGTADSQQARVEWTDDSTGDVIRVRSDELPIDDLVDVADAISVTD
jgi:hypothetical protein